MLQKKDKSLYHMTRTACVQFSWKTIREKVPYEGRTRRSNKAEETRKALLETPMAKLMRVNDKTNFIATKFCCFKNES